MTTVGPDKISARLDAFSEQFDGRAIDFLDALDNAGADPHHTVLPQLGKAMRYTLLAPGKRVRPYLATRCCELAGSHGETALPAAVAIECVHAFSLIHDDLPCMDDDAVRRGQPANHMQFGEAMAVLAGDSLLTLAFEALAARVANASQAAACVCELARATGGGGMIGGQAADMLWQGLSPDRSLIDRIHEQKTAQLFACACKMGAILAGAPAETQSNLAGYGRCLGRAFQIADDLLDVSGRPARVGKTIGKDQAVGKQSLPACVGTGESRSIALGFIEQAKGHLAGFGPDADDLRGLADFVLQRDH